jgi:hypothetical protein
MTVNLSPLGGAGAQFFDNNGVILSGGKIYTYAAGTVTPQAVYTSVNGVTPHANPIILDSAGRVPGGEIWLTDGVSYKFVIETSASILLGTYDNLAGINVTQTAAEVSLTPSGYTTATNVQTAFNDLGSSAGSSKVGFIAAGAGAVSLSAQTKMRQFVTPQDFGAVANGVTNDAAAFVAADAVGGTLRVPAGNYAINSSVTFASAVSFDFGAILILGTGVVIAFNNQMIAGPQQVFQIGAGASVTFNWNKTSEGFSEWWGAIPNSPGAAAGNVTAINAALIALRKVQLVAGDYWINSRIYMGLPWRELSGVAERFDGAVSNFVTRILQTSASADVIQVGPDTFPGSINALFQGNKVNNVYVGRTVAPDIAAAVSGIKNQYTLYALFENVMCAESIFGFQFFGTVQTQAYRCWAFRTVAGSGAGPDRFYGFYVNGSATIPGLNSGNASLYLNYCNGTVGGSPPADSVGFYLDDGFTDAFLESPEATSCRIGIQIVGDGLTGPFAFTNGDLQIKNPVMDAFSYAGIFLQNCNKFGSVEIIGGYHGAAAGARAAIAVDNCKGQIRVNGGQAIMVAATGSSGISIDASNGVTIDGTIIMEALISGVDATNANNCVFKPIVKNYNTTMTGAIVRMFSTCSRNIIAPVGYGSAGVYPIGVQLVSTGNSFTEINCSGMDPAAITGGSANKLTINGVQITATGLSGNNLVSGVMA